MAVGVIKAIVIWKVLEVNFVKGKVAIRWSSCQILQIWSETDINQFFRLFKFNCGYTLLEIMKRQQPIHWSTKEPIIYHWNTKQSGYFHSRSWSDKKLPSDGFSMLAISINRNSWISNIPKRCWSIFSSCRDKIRLITLWTETKK